MEILFTIFSFVMLISIIVGIHELGHFLVARYFNIHVLKFKIGFGKEIFGFNDKNGTRWKFCLIPLGGYVKFFGDRNVFSQAEQQDILKKYSEEDQKKLFILSSPFDMSLPE